MTDASDAVLLERFAREGSEAAFALLVQRHIGLVHSVALRHTANSQHAEDITQTVFVILARKAPALGRKTVLPGWLYHTARLTAANLQRAEVRRIHREQEAFMQSTSEDNGTDPVWRELSPRLDEAMAGLGESERDALVLRYFQNKSIAEVSEFLGVEENTAQKRVGRALEKLRKFFVRRGVSSTAAAIAIAISAKSVQAVPPALTKMVTVAALAKGTAASASTLTLIKGALKFMAWTNAKTVVVSGVIVGLAAVSAWQHRAQTELQQQNDVLQQQMTQMRADNEKLVAAAQTARMAPPAPLIVLMTNGPALGGGKTTNLYARLFTSITNGTIKLTPEQADAFLAKNGRTAANLLAAFRTSHNPDLLKEAMEKYPNDPQVAFEAVAYNSQYLTDPAEQRKWLDAFEKSAPNNAMANYLSALNYFNSGQIEQGLQDMSSASGKSLNDYTVNRVESDMEAYLSAGYSVPDAEVLSSSQLMLPQLAQVKQLAQESSDLAKAYNQGGDTASAQTVLQLAYNMGQQYATQVPGESAISQLVGFAAERIALSGMDPNAAFGDGGQTVQDTINQIAQQRDNLKQLSSQTENLSPLLSDQDWVVYKNRWLMFGEQNAEQWVISKYGQQ